MNRTCSIVAFLFALVILVTTSASCAAVGGGGLVAQATGDMHGALRANSEWVVLVGEGDLDYGLALQGIGPITIPTKVARAHWGAYSIRTGKMFRGSVATDPLPFGTSSLFPPGDAAAISARFEMPPITFASEATPVIPAAPVSDSAPVP